MLTYEQQDQKISEEPFIRRVAQAGVVTALAVMAEDTATPGHVERAAFAQQFLGNPVETGRRVARGVVTNTNCGNGDESDPLVSDTTLAWVLASMWDAYSNVGGLGVGSIPAAIAAAAPVMAEAAEMEKPPWWKRVRIT